MPQEEINGYVARLFDKDLPTTQPADLPLPFSSENPPPSVRVTIILIIFNLYRYILLACNLGSLPQS
jgi:hypothetical protein